MKFSDISDEIKNAVDYIVEDSHDKVSEFSGSSVIKVWNNNQIKSIERIKNRRMTFARPSAGKINYEKKLLFVLTIITKRIPQNFHTKCLI
jgi:hypothetical protein